MIKALILIPAILLVGCEAPEWVDTFFGAPEGGGQAPVETVGGLLGPWGVAISGLVAAGYQTLTKQKVHKDKVQLIKDLGADAYDKYGSFSATDKKKLDSDIKEMIPAKYRKYYDLGKEIVK